VADQDGIEVLERDDSESAIGPWTRDRDVGVGTHRDHIVLEPPRRELGAQDWDEVHIDVGEPDDAQSLHREMGDFPQPDQIGVLRRSRPRCDNPAGIISGDKRGEARNSAAGSWARCGDHLVDVGADVEVLV
jgi:hypothetical protein